MKRSLSYLVVVFAGLLASPTSLSRAARGEDCQLLSKKKCKKEDYCYYDKDSKECLPSDNIFSKSAKNKSSKSGKGSKKDKSGSSINLFPLIFAIEECPNILDKKDCKKEKEYCEYEKKTKSCLPITCELLDKKKECEKEEICDYDEDDKSCLTQPAFQALSDGTVQSGIEIDTSLASQGPGEAILRILPGNNNVEISNYNADSFQLENTGQQDIVGIFIDVTDAIFSDVVFDDDGSGGDDVAKPLSFDSDSGDVGPIDINLYPWQWLPARSDDFDATELFVDGDPDTYFVDETSDNSLVSPQAGGGFRGELLLFESFEPGDTFGFSGDMDPNSIAGLTKATVDNGAGWDVGGVSGAEMIHSTVTVLFRDGSIASGRLASDGSQAGSVVVLSNSVPLLEAPNLEVNGFSPGESGTYSMNTATMVVTGPPSAIVRVSFASCFNPVVSTATVAGGPTTVQDLVQARLDSQYPEFPCNNAGNWQHLEWQIPASGRLEESVSLVFANDLPFASVAVLIDGGLPVSHTSDPIRLLYVP